MESPEEQMTWLMRTLSFLSQACINSEKDIFFTTSTAIIPACAGSRAMGKLYHTLEVINTFLKIQFYDTLLYVLLNGRDLDGDKM